MPTAKDTGPLTWNVPIVNPKTGNPTVEFQRRWETQRGNNALIGTVSFGSGAPTGSPEDGALYVDTSVDPAILYVGEGGTWLQVGPATFLELQDTPDTYVGEGEKLVRVTTIEDGLEFIATFTLTADPTATASDTAVNGTADTFMRSDAAPAIQKASASQFGVVKVDGTTVTATGGVISATGGGGGGGSTPSIRATAQGSWNAMTVAIPFPTGTIAGDTVIVYWSSGYRITTGATGWYNIWLSDNGGNFNNQGCIGKVVDSSDISTGSVTVGAIGSYFGSYFAITLDGSTTSVVYDINHFDSSGGSSVASQPIYGLLHTPTTALSVGFCSTRGNMTQTLSAGLTSLGSVSSADASGIFFTIDVMGVFGANELVTNPAGNSGCAFTIISLGGP